MTDIPGRGSGRGREPAGRSFYTHFVAFFILTGFVLGLLFGSFLNVCIARVPRGESVVHPPSHCPRCQHPIRWFDNVPLISWLLLRGRCRDCHAPISWQYPAVELATGIWFAIQGLAVWADWNIGKPGFAGGAYTASHSFLFTVGSLLLAVLGFLLIGLIVMDWQTFRLPDAFTLSGVAIAIFLVCVQAIFLGPKDDQIVLNATHQLRLSSPGSFAAQGNVFITGPEHLIFSRIFASAGAALILLLVRWGYKAARKRDGLGLGDVKLLAMIAAFLGFWPAILTLFVGTLLASGYALLLIARGKAGGLTRLPLGSFLGVAGLFAALAGPAVIDWYQTFLH